MRAVLILARKELRDGLRDRWVAATILLLAALALSLAFLGSAPVGNIKASAMSVTVASLSSLTVYLLPLIALMLSFDALVGEFERGTMLLLLTYPVARWQVVVGKFLGQVGILMLAILIGYGGAGLAIAATSSTDPESWQAYLAMMSSSLLLGSVFLALGFLVSVVVHERATAVGGAVGLWLGFVVLYDLALLGALLADEGQRLGQAILSTLMLINPTDVYRIFNLTGSEGVSLVSGMAGMGANFGHGLMLAILACWVVIPLAATTLLFKRKEL